MASVGKRRAHHLVDSISPCGLLLSWVLCEGKNHHALSWAGGWGLGGRLSDAPVCVRLQRVLGWQDPHFTDMEMQVSEKLNQKPKGPSR